MTTQNEKLRQWLWWTIGFKFKKMLKLLTVFRCFRSIQILTTGTELLLIRTEIHPVRPWWKKTRLIVAEKKFASRYESKLIAQLETFGLSKFWSMKTTTDYFFEFSSKSVNCFITTVILDRRNQTCSYWERWDWIMSWNKFVNQLGKFVQSALLDMNQNKKSLNYIIQQKLDAFDWQIVRGNQACA